MVFHEITEDAIGNGHWSDTRELNMELVHAQETRRILDRLVGYTRSRRCSGKRWPGAFQPAGSNRWPCGLLVQRERARRAFCSGSYWDLKAQLEHGRAVAFEAKLSHAQGWPAHRHR